MSTPQAGGRMTALAFREAAPLTAVKSTDQSIASSTTLANDNALFLTLTAGATYLLWAYLDYEAPVAAGFKFGWAVPASTTMRYQALPATGTNTESSVVTETTSGAGALLGVTLTGLVVAGASGTLQLQWAQSTSNATPAIVHAKSFLALWLVL